jgi:hypothetical protein
MAVITNHTAVACMPEELFDCCVEIRNEVDWNPTPVSMELTAGPVDARTRAWCWLVFPLFAVMTPRQEKLRVAVERRAGDVPDRSDR